MISTRLFPSAPQRLLFALFVAPWLLAASGSAAQDTTPGDASFDDLIEVSEVLLDVLVTDADGNVVVGLGPDDFVVVEEADGQQKELTGVSFYSNRIALGEDAEPARVQRAAPGEVLADRYFVLFFDAVPSVPGARLAGLELRAGRDAARWAREEMIAGDWVAVVGYDRKLRVYSDFTQDRAVLEAAIANASSHSDPNNDWPSRRSELVDGRPSILDDLPQGDALRDATETRYEAIELLAEATEDILGRKNLMLFTLGFGDLRRGPLTLAEPDQRYYPSMLHALNDANMAIYPIHLTQNVRTPQSNFLNRIADDTGGDLIDAFTSYFTPLREIGEETNGYYLLSYQAEHPAGSSGYREVQVATRDPSLNIRARRGYTYGD
ncbi:MAG: VWA domain-containing protein [Acidobacteriota bacterium]